MTKRRVALAISIAVTAAAALVFYSRQNSGLHVGGAISLPKMLWLAYAVFAWFVMPVFLWTDRRLDYGVRRIFRSFWLVMMPRGVAELVLVYGFGHWTPWYGIAHDLLCVVVLLHARHACAAIPAEPPWSARARRFSGALVVALLAETVFAAMFLQSGVHRDAIYFASADASWGFVNLVTTVVVAFVYADLLATIVGLYLPGVAARAPGFLGRGALWVRAGAAAAVLLVICSSLGLWLWMHRVEGEARRYQEVGYAVVDSCMTFRDDFLRGDEAAMRGFIDPEADGVRVRWIASPVEHPHDFELRPWKDGGDERALLDVLLDMRRRIEPTDAAFKIHLVDEVGDGEARVQLRFEVNGPVASDQGLLRCAFRECDDGRWRVREAALVHADSIAGSARQFRDRAAERGLDFVMEPDDRFVPGAVCDDHLCLGPTEVKFQIMRHAYAGCATADVNGDGSDDLFLCAGARSELYLNDGSGSFRKATRELDLPELWHVNTAGFADLDNDGDQDLFVGSFYGRNRLFANDGTGRFRDVTAHSGLGADDMTSCFSFLDSDGDGDLELYLGRFLDSRVAIPDSFLYARNGQPNILYRNDGGLRFTNVTERAGVGDVGLALSLAAADYDEDGDQDLYVANDFGRNVLYRNRGDGTFEEVSRETNTTAIGGSMSASWGDANNDGRLDLYVAAIRSNQRWFVQPITARRVVLKFIREGKIGHDNPLLSDLREYIPDHWTEIGNHALAGNSLLVQGPDHRFTDIAREARARPAGWYWSSGFLDFDHDGDLDVLATNGWITGRKSHDL